MRQECVIARLNEPHIAHLYVIDLDQNLINNIRVLCTKYPETVRYFVPEELFLELRNGFPVPMTAECCDREGSRLIPIDPLKVLSEQLAEVPGPIPEPEEIELRICVKGYELPVPGEGMGFLPRTPQEKPRSTQEKPRYSAREPAGYGRTVWRSRSARRRLVRRAVTIAVALVMLLAAAAFWFIKDASVRRFEEEMNASKYKEAVSIYNDRILGHPAGEAKADPLVENTVDALVSGYLAEERPYETVKGQLGILTGIGKEELSQLAQDAMDEIDLNENAASVYKEGLTKMENGNLVGAMEDFLLVQETSRVYEDAQSRLELCVERLVRSAVNARTEEEYAEADGKLDAAIELWPENEQLLEGKETSRSKHVQLIRNGAIAAADGLIGEGDYAGAFKQIRIAQETLPDDERLEEKNTQYRRLYAAYITRKVCGMVDEGDLDGALSLLDEASEISESDEFDELQSEIEDAADREPAEIREYTAGEVQDTKSKATVKKKGQKNAFTVKPSESGPHRLTITKVSKGLTLGMTVLGPDGNELYKNDKITGNTGTTCQLEEGRTYTIEVTAAAGKGSYVFTARQQKPTAEISDYDVVRDLFEFAGQQNQYIFVPEESGIYRIDLETEGNLSSVKLSLFDSAGSRIDGGELESGEGITIRLEAGTPCTIRATYSGKAGGYTLWLGKQRPSTDITGQNIVAGEITYKDQRNSYKFKAEEEGSYRITAGNFPDDCSLKLYLYDGLGYKISGEDYIESGGSVTAELASGQTYEVLLIQNSGKGKYTLTVCKEE